MFSQWTIPDRVTVYMQISTVLLPSDCVY